VHKKIIKGIKIYGIITLMNLDVERAQRNIKKAQLMNFDVERIKRKIKKAQLMTQRNSS
jgi:hypothetical protein